MKTRIEANRVTELGNEELTVEIGAGNFGENVVITKTVRPQTIFSNLKIGDVQLGCQMPERDPVSVELFELSMCIDAETARALSFALSELARVLRGREC